MTFKKIKSAVFLILLIIAGVGSVHSQELSHTPEPIRSFADSEHKSQLDYVGLQLSNDDFSDKFYTDGFNGNIITNLQTDSSLIIGGWFTAHNDVVLNGIAEWTGTDWSPIGIGFNNFNGPAEVMALAEFNNQLVAGGFIERTGEESIGHIAAWNGSEWQQLGSLPGPVRALQVYNGNLYAGGDFPEMYNLAMWDGNDWVPVKAGVDGTVYSLTTHDTLLVIGGNFSQALNETDKLENTLFTGTYNIIQLDTSTSVAVAFESGWLFNNTNEFQVDLSVMDDAVTNRVFNATPMASFGVAQRQYGLSFYREEGSTTGEVTLSGEVTTGLACSELGVNYDGGLNGTAYYDSENDSSFTFTVVENSTEDCGLPVDTLRFQADKLGASKIMAKDIRSVDAKRIVAYDGASWITLTDSLPAEPRDLISFENTLYAAGEFGVWRWANGFWFTSDNNSLEGSAYELFVNSDGNLAAAGTFEISDDPGSGPLAYLDNSDWTSVIDTTVARYVFTAGAYQGDYYFAAGNANIYPAKVLDSSGNRYGSDGSAGIGLSGNGALGMATHLYEGDIILGGTFKYAGQTEVNNIARLSNGQWHAMDSGLSGTFRSFATFGNDLYAGNTEGLVYRWDTKQNNWSMAGDTVGNGIVWRMAVYNDSLYAGGESGYIKRYNPGENSWEMVGDTLNGSRVRGMAVYNNELYIAGIITSFGEDTVNNVARWDETSRSWQAVGSGFQGFPSVLTVYNGELYAGGGMSGTADGSTSFNGVAKWDENSQSWLDASMGINSNPFVSAIDEYEGELYLGKISLPNLLKWDDSNQMWTEVGSLNDLVYNMTGKDGWLFIPGWFTLAGGKAATGITRYNTGTGVSIEEPVSEYINGYRLSQNYPNPFNPSTQISYTIPEASQVSIEVYDMLGRKVVSLVNERKTAGTYSVTFNASALSSGVYIYRIEAGNFITNRKMTLIK